MKEKKQKTGKTKVINLIIGNNKANENKPNTYPCD